MATAGTHDIVIDQGARWSLALTWQDSEGTPINLTGYTIAGQVRTTFADLDGELLADMVPTVISAADGQLELSIPTAVTVDMPAGSWRWDLEVGPTGGEVSRLLMGRALVRAEVTRSD